MRFPLRLILFVVFFPLAGCTAYIIKPNYGIEGTITEINTHARVHDVEFEIREQIGSGGANEVTTHCCATTNDHGYFNYEFQGYFKGDPAFIPIVTSEQDIQFYYQGISLEELKRGKTVTWNLTCLGAGKLYLRFVNATPFNSTDVISNIYIGRPEGYQQSVGANRNLALFDVSVDTTLQTTYWGYSTHILHYSVTKNSVTVNHADTLYTSTRGSDPYYYQINY